jgi:hypothetical protein
MTIWIPLKPIRSVHGKSFSTPHKCHCPSGEEAFERFKNVNTNISVLSVKDETGPGINSPLMFITDVQKQLN